MSDSNRIEDLIVRHFDDALESEAEQLELARLLDESAEARDLTLGNCFTKRAYLGRTAAMTVCWSMISLTQTK